MQYALTCFSETGAIMCSRIPGVDDMIFAAATTRRRQGKTSAVAVQSPTQTDTPPPRGEGQDGSGKTNRGSQKSSLSPKTQRFVECDDHVGFMLDIFRSGEWTENF